MNTTDHTITDGWPRFQVVFNEIGKIILSSKNKRNKALFFYEAGTRNQLFKAEALSRIYRSIVGKKIFDPLNDEYKRVEDQLGKIDYYDGFLKEFSAHKNLPESFLRYFKSGKENELKVFNEMLKSGNCFLTEKDKQEEMITVLKGLKWPIRTDERKNIIHFLTGQIDKLVQQYEDGELHFNDMENGLHEFRRKLRWISIYAQALKGFIQVKKIKLIPDSFKTYMTPDIVTSPFNKLPPMPVGLKPAEIQEHFFFALSWMIQESGRLKDAGLKILAVKNAIQHADLKKKNAAEAIKNALLPKGSLSIAEISEKMEHITDRFIHKDRVLHAIRRDLLRSLHS